MLACMLFLSPYLLFKNLFYLNGIYSYKQLLQELKNMTTFREIKLFDLVSYISCFSFSLKYDSQKSVFKNDWV